MWIVKLLTLIILISIIIFFIKFNKKDVVYVKSDLDERKYLVRDLKDKQMAANMLAKIRKNIFILVDYLNENKNRYPNYIQSIEQLVKKIQNVIILESDDGSNYTSYSINKGEQIVFCIRSKKNKNKIHDLNLIMYVVLHELGHVGCKEHGHTELFKNIFAFFTMVAIDIGLYKKIDFEKDPTEYCGLTITDSII
ncbi:Hypothetical protein KVN_LOCUS322 [uncultured virus]|nr:Hypothetical protein KVN_LOCUS322 [uncultured virus]